MTGQTILQGERKGYSGQEEAQMHAVYLEVSKQTPFPGVEQVQVEGRIGLGTRVETTTKIEWKGTAEFKFQLHIQLACSTIEG